MKLGTVYVYVLDTLWQSVDFGFKRSRVRVSVTTNYGGAEFHLYRVHIFRFLHIAE